MDETRADAEVLEELFAELRWELGEAAHGVEAAFASGVAVLTGRVRTTDERRRALAAALRLEEVTDVVDALGVVVSGGRPEPDARLAAAVRRALQWDSFAPDERIKTTVCRGWVTLHGCVPHMTDVRDAERAVRHVSPCGLTSLLEVGWPSGDAAGLRGALEREARPVPAVPAFR